MKKNEMNMKYKRIEQKLSQIGAKIAHATDLSRQAKELSNSSESTLITVQKEIQVLYVSLEDDDPSEASEN